MKVVIAGGRTFVPMVRHAERLDSLGITEVVSGCAPGADRFGEDYAERRGLRLTRFPANWDKYKAAAGPIRNRVMAEYADAVVLFPGGAGTASMKAEAHRAGIKVYDWREDG